jgi:SAM-dependent methyltransferase
VTEPLGVNENSAVYYAGTYWNDLEAVRRRINSKISGIPTLKWHEHFAHSTGRKFRRALILNCGNGWVERELLEHGLIAEGVGLDYSRELLAEADAEAKRAGLPLTYQQGNINTDPLPPGEFDLVVNHAAAHHIAAIDGVFRQVCRLLPEDGWFVSFDYVGSHRNQYGLEAWERAWQMNERLPTSLRQEMTYPRLPVMLVVDPTEAIHSELIASTFERYFTPLQFTPLGGAIAYLLLTHNERLFAAPDSAERDDWIEEILDADDQFLAEHPDSTLFAYFAGTPAKSALGRTELLAQWEAEEAERERRAQANGGEYYASGPLATTLVALDQQRARNEAERARADRLAAQLRAMESRRSYASARRLVNSSWATKVRRQRVVAVLERRMRSSTGR